MPEYGLVCSQLKKTAGRITMDLDFSVAKGELVSVIGPEGSGKTTLLRLICGLDTPDSGTVSIDGRDVTALPPEKRNTAIILPDYAIFPNMSIEQNIVYSLGNRRLSKEEKTAEARRLMDLVNLSGVDKKKPAELTEEEKFRVAFARAIAAQPDIMLMDDTLSSLDNRARKILRNDIRDIQVKTGVTMIFASASQEEALCFSDRVIVLRGGKIEQTGTPEDIYRRPVSEFSARFTGEVNILPYDVILRTLRVPETERSKVIYQCFGPEHRLVFRPEDMVVNDMPGLPFPEFYPHLRFENAKIIRTEYLGKEYLVTAQYEDLVIKVYTVYKPASDYITAGIRMTKILEFNDGKLIRH